MADAIYGSPGADGLSFHTEPLTVRIEGETTRVPPWDFPGWGRQLHDAADPAELKAIDDHMASKHAPLGQWPATAICGNDILSSCLYTAGVAAAKAGKLAPVAMAMVAAVLYLYRFIYGEVVNAIPLNGGSYNVLLNTTSKRLASIAAALGILSYVATGVVSGTSACTYLASQVHGLEIVHSSIALLFLFAILAIIGISESAVVALLIFAVHTITLIVLCVASIVFVIRDQGAILTSNYQAPYPDINMAGQWIDGSVWTALFFGTSTAMLGISGFETSAQFVEEQAPGVFPKTLRNMWWGVVIFNPLISFLALGVLPLSAIQAHKNTVLAAMGKAVGGHRLEAWVALDAFVVLSGAVLTSYVGITGLVRRMAYDRILPAFLLHTNRCRGTNHNIILLYFAIASSLVLALHGQVDLLSGVYTFAFLGLMVMFGMGCMLLKFKRADLRRNVIAPWWSCIVGVLLMLTALVGNLLGDPTVLTYFALYFLAVLCLVEIMFERVVVLRFLKYFVEYWTPSAAPGHSAGHRLLDDDASVLSPDEHTGPLSPRGPGTSIAKVIQAINLPPIFFFAKQPHLPTLNKAILYVRKNEQTAHLFIVHVGSGHLGFGDVVSLFDRMYPKLRIDFLRIEGGSFGPAVVEWVSRKYETPKNLMFIKQPNHDCAHTIASLGGVRVITG
ncbi:hypothetical protein SDRG_15943 [Saprolegnia diclina VS20]|uniref:Amino acid permease/ SLC12A domain-containing protein n=1 Tax=Saprolegnia diclina (strain VS20) TaxID=1156394 RepID=T0PVB9_SAPDV|nr:hypothetical protein SDRG_15943 [Saprolegnia diclina VS20]EQC26206.1 hypothetical protein SDRG_15943 [Saprolegnia diclina VS20]|eukprot:XP_008620351.1 hypothetical protein SDRG_15943 [Saprolegnia diclina VS20]